MNKTVNINLGGMLFHIDEDAYHKLNDYLAAIKRSLSSTEGQDEIVKDIEMRIAELISEKHNNGNQIINIKTLDDIIAVMGQPEDYRIDSENEESATTYTETNRPHKKLYRDSENGMIGGVASGLSYYFGIDVVWLRIIWVISIFAGFGFGLIGYLILWIVTPKAVTTSEKLEMTGEAVTIKSIENKVREEFDNVSGKFKNADYNKMGNQAKTGLEKFIYVMGEILKGVIKLFSKFVGVLLIIISIPVLIALVIGIFSMGTITFIGLPWHDLINAGNLTAFPNWSFGLLIFFSVGIPFFFLMLLGFKLLISHIKSIGNPAKYTLLAMWVISIIVVSAVGFNYQAATAYEGRIINKEFIRLKPHDTLSIKFRHNDYFSKNAKHTTDWLTTKDSTENDVIYSNQVNLNIEKTDDKLPYLQIEKQADGKSISEARKTAEKINYGYSIKGNQMIFDNYLLTELKNKYHDQEILITVFLPENTIIQLDPNTENFIDSDYISFNLKSGEKKPLYKINDSKIKCLNCTDFFNATDSTVTISVKVNGQEIIDEKRIDKKWNNN